jgi:hypothetical protein
MSDEAPMPGPLEYPRLQRPPCPNCQSRQTIQVVDDGSVEKLYCPDYAWQWLTKPAATDAPMRNGSQMAPEHSGGGREPFQP